MGGGNQAAWLGNHLALGQWLLESAGKVKARGETENEMEKEASLDLES